VNGEKLQQKGPDPPKIPTENHPLRGAIEHSEKNNCEHPDITLVNKSDPNKNWQILLPRIEIRNTNTKPPTSTGCSRSAKTNVHCTRSPLDSSHVPKVPKLRLDSPLPEPESTVNPEPFVEFLVCCTSRDSPLKKTLYRGVVYVCIYMYIFYM